MRIIQKTINHFFSLNTYPLSFVIIQQQISADRLLGEKSVSHLSGSARGKNFGAIKLKTFFSQFWKKPSFRHERDQRSSGESGQEAQRRGDFSPAARAGARCEYILCLPVLPSSVAKVSRLEQTREEGGRKGRGGPACHVTPRGANVRS